jgi:hypothetical protein
MISIFTYAHKRPDFIEMQYETIKKYLKCEYEFVVFNNAIDNVQQYSEIHSICKRLNIKCVDVELEKDMQVTTGVTNFNGNAYITPNVACSYPIMWSFRNYVTTEKLVCILDSDMFFVNDVDLVSIIEDKDIVYIPQYRQNHKIKYIWNAFVLLNLAKRPELKNLDWTPAPINGENMDVGSQTHYYVKKTDLIDSYLEEYSIRDFIKTSEGYEIQYIQNGNINYMLTYNSDMKLVKIAHAGGQAYSNVRSFPYETEATILAEKISDKVKSIVEYIKTREANLPDPYHIAFIGEQDSNYHFILHYKSGSNYLTFTTDEYNARKTAGVKKLL